MNTIYLTPKQYKQLRRSVDLIDVQVGDIINITTEVDVTVDDESNSVQCEHLKIEIISPFKLLTKTIHDSIR